VNKRIIALVLIALFVLTGSALATRIPTDRIGDYRDGGVDGTILVKAPAKGAILPVGTDQQITWKYTGFTGQKVKIVLFQDGKQVTTIAEGIDVITKKYMWSVPIDLATAADYEIKVVSETRPWCYGFSDKFAVK
jgi:hypothetical protein